MIISTNALRCGIAFFSSARDYHGREQLVLEEDGQVDRSPNLTSLGNNVQITAAEEEEDTKPSKPDIAPTISYSPLEADDVAKFQDPLPPSSYLSLKHHFSVGSTGDQWAITYTPYNDDLTCKTKAAIQEDVAIIAKKGFTSIRVYATDCSTLKHVGSAAASHKLKLILGVHIDDTILMLAQPQINEIVTWAAGKWDRVEMIVIGNEAIFNEFTTAAMLAEFISSSRTILREAGYTGPITTTEPLNILSKYTSTLCPVIDVAAANIHPFFHPEVSADTAGDYVAVELDRLEELCEGMQGVNLETGWPKQGIANGAAVPGVLEQWVAVAGIQKAAGGRSVFLGYADDGWKDEGEFGVETSWGSAHIFGIDA
ncbi:hypothetical protein ABVK25_006902 [Lepraria finkii]|uniref:Probable beta-glucosidase btgE n=1 Tax=Lepraria finkii TaxID=1340010 RepID=A0ABR4B518_9LECA